MRVFCLFLLLARPERQGYPAAEEIQQCLGVRVRQRFCGRGALLHCATALLSHAHPRLPRRALLDARPVASTRTAAEDGRAHSAPLEDPLHVRTLRQGMRFGATLWEYYVEFYRWASCRRRCPSAATAGRPQHIRRSCPVYIVSPSSLHCVPTSMQELARDVEVPMPCIEWTRQTADQPHPSDHSLSVNSGVFCVCALSPAAAGSCSTAC